MANKQLQPSETIITSRKDYIVEIKGIGGILFNKMPDLSISKTEKKDQAKVDLLEQERLNWREKLYIENGSVVVPGENIHESLKEGSKYWGQKIQGEGNKTYTDVVASSIICESLNLGISKDSAAIIPFGKNVNSNPSKGKKSGSKVYKIRPILQPWGGTFRMFVFDARLTIPVLKTIIAYSGMYKGLCDWRPVYGRFDLVKIEEC